jgi:hypothetical protein
VVEFTRDALTLAGAYGDSERVLTGSAPADVKDVKAAQARPPDAPSAATATARRHRRCLRTAFDTPSCRRPVLPA